MGQKVFLDFLYDVSVNTLGELDQHSCNPDMNHNYDMIFYDMVAHENERQFNCSVPFHPLTKSKFTGEDIEICRNSTTGKEALDNWSNTCGAGPQTTQNKPCTGVDIFLGLPFIDEDKPENESSIRIYIKSDVKVKSVIMYYDFTTLAADLGGYIGMFLGVSLIDFTILFNTALLTLTMKLKQKYSRSEEENNL